MSDLHVPAPLRLADLQPTRLLVVLWGGLAVVDIGHLLGAPPLPQLAAVTALVAGCAFGARHAVAAGVAAIGWLVANGFVVHSLGQLGFVGTSDLLRGLLLLAVALAAAELAR